jgi:hypothetical protein
MSDETIPVAEAAALTDETVQTGWIWVRKPSWCPKCLLPSAVPVRRMSWVMTPEGVERHPVEPWGLFCADHNGWVAR